MSEWYGIDEMDMVSAARSIVEGGGVSHDTKELCAPWGDFITSWKDQFDSITQTTGICLYDTPLMFWFNDTSIMLRTHYGDHSPSAVEGCCLLARAAFKIYAQNGTNKYGKVILRNLNECLMIRYSIYGIIENLSNALTAARMNIDHFELSEPEAVPAWRRLTKSYWAMFRRDYDVKVLNEAIDRGQKLMETSKTPSALSLHLYDLWMEKYNYSHDLHCVEQCMGICEPMIHEFASEEKRRMCLDIWSLEDFDVNLLGWWQLEYQMWLQRLSVCCDHRYSATCEQKDLTRAIALATEASKDIPSIEDDDPSKVGHMASALNSAAAALIQLYNVTHSLEHLNHSIEVFERMNGMYENNDRQGRADVLLNLTSVLHARYVRSKSTADLDKAILLSRELVSLGTSDRIYGQAILSLMLSEKFECDYDLEIRHQYLSLALSVRQRLPEVTRDRSEVVSTICFIWEVEVRNLKLLGAKEELQVKRLDELIELLEGTLTKDDMSEDTKQEAHYRVGCAMLKKYKLTGQNLTEAIKHLRDSVERMARRPDVGVVWSIKTAKALWCAKDWHEAYKILKAAIELLPRMSSQTLTQDDQQHMLRFLSKLASNACSTTLHAGRPVSEALALLEASRGSIAAFILRSKGVPDLEASHPLLYQKHKTLLNALAKQSEPSHLNIRPHQEFQLGSGSQIAQTIQRIDVLEAHIRSIPEYSNFNLPPRPDELMGLALEGPLVSFNISNLRADAIIVTSSDIKSVPLPDVTKDILKKMVPSMASHGNVARRDVRVLNSTALKSMSDKEDLLTGQGESYMWLWEALVKPVLESLGFLRFDRKSSEELPCIWWVGGGLLSTVPLHAAGNHHSSSLENTISHVVSSYAPTMRTLRYARKASLRALDTDQIQCLLVAMPQTANEIDLQVASEIEAIQSQAQMTSNVITLEGKGKSDVMNKLSTATIVHFACHGISDPANPLDSRLLLGDTENDHLRVRDLKGLNLKSSQIAYLSACSTAELLDRRLLEESVHLASIFQLVGFPHVIGTMWGAYDDVAVQVASAFYKSLLALYLDLPGGSTVGDGYYDIAKGVRYALHNAICDVRERNPDPTYWAPFIHLGP